MTTLRILIADDHAAVRRGIRKLLETQPRWIVCGEASNGGEAIEQARRYRPDVVLLDVSMPVINGLDAAREIKRVAPDTHMVMLTTHVGDELTSEMRRTGAAAVIAKSHADESLVDTIEGLTPAGSAVHLGSRPVGEHRHIGAFFKSDDERYRVLAPFIAEGLAAGEKSLHLIDPPRREHHARKLLEHGVDVDAPRARRQLQLLSWDDTYLRDGVFDRHAMAGLIERFLAFASNEGFARLRLIANMEWALEDHPGVRDLISYELQVNDFLSHYPDVVICAYDLSRFGGDVVMDAFRAHPAVLIGGELRDNPFYARHQA